MTARQSRAFAGFLVSAALVFGADAAADQIWIASVTCIAVDSPASCTDLATGPVQWRVLNVVPRFDVPFPGANDLQNVTLQFEFPGGSSTSHWDLIEPAATGVFAETNPFDASLVKQLVSLRLGATLRVPSSTSPKTHS